MKVCSTCGRNLLESNFYTDRRTHCGLTASCKKCAGAAWKIRYANRPNFVWDIQLRTKYGISVEEYTALLQAQRGLCAICKNPCPKGRQKKLSVDHCHKTGKVRGLLCTSCNLALGHLKHSVKNLASATLYLKNS